MAVNPFLSALYAGLSVLGFAVLFNIPRRSLLWAGLCGAAGWLVFRLCSTLGAELAAANFLAALTVGLCGEVLALLRRQPATLFIVPGIIPLVPGYGLYRSVYLIISEDWPGAMAAGFETVLVALVIATAILLSTALARISGRIFRRVPKPKKC